MRKEAVRRELNNIIDYSFLNSPRTEDYKAGDKECISNDTEITFENISMIAKHTGVTK